MLNRLLDWITKRGGRRMIMRDGKPYLERFYIFHSKRLAVMIHKFYASDPDEPHDHPWNWASKILRGTYFERNVDTTGKWWTSKDGWRFRRAEEFHRIEVDETLQAGYTTTLFITFGRRRKWGFLRGDKWLPAEGYDRQPVDVAGRDFVIEGHFFPRVRWLRTIRERWDTDYKMMLPTFIEQAFKAALPDGPPNIEVKEGKQPRKYSDAELMLGLFGYLPESYKKKTSSKKKATRKKKTTKKGKKNDPR